MIAIYKELFFPSYYEKVVKKKLSSIIKTIKKVYQQKSEINIGKYLIEKQD